MILKTERKARFIRAFLFAQITRYAFVDHKLGAGFYRKFSYKAILLSGEDEYETLDADGINAFDALEKLVDILREKIEGEDPDTTQ